MSLLSASSTADKIRRHAQELGFDICSFTSPTIDESDARAYQEWLRAGSAAGMAYMAANADKRQDPKKLVDGVATVVTLGVSYFQGERPEKPGAPVGRVARYAWGSDYHDALTARLRRFADELPALLGRDVQAHLAVDTKPVLERALARSAGSGFIGKNTVLIARRAPGVRYHVGSWLFLAELFLNIDVEREADEPLPAKGCGGCTRCIDVCPTNAFDGPYKLNAGRCISYLTIENKGPIPREIRPSLGDWIFGCDACQDVCPFNARAQETRWPEFRPASGAGPWISLTDLLSLPDGPAFRKRWGGTALLRAKRDGLLRNACVVAGNNAEESLTPLLEERTRDASALIRAHALWAVNRLDKNRGHRLAETLRLDPDAVVREEAEHWLSGAAA